MVNIDLNFKILEILTKKRYCRDKPYFKDKIIERMNCFISRDKPIKLIGYWGVGPKNKANWADIATCEFLSQLNEEIKREYSYGINFTFILATTYGIFNGIPERTIGLYAKEIEKIFQDFGFNFIYLDILWEKYKINFEKITSILEQKEKNWWKEIVNHQIMEKNAKNRNQCSNIDPNISAKKFFVMRELEKEMLKEEFSDSIFHVFSDSSFRSIHPDMPTLYFYARKDWSNVPWFIVDEKTMHSIA